MGLWHKSATIAYLAVFLGGCGHASSEIVSVLCVVGGPELSFWRFVAGRFRPCDPGIDISGQPGFDRPV